MAGGVSVGLSVIVKSWYAVLVSPRESVWVWVNEGAAAPLLEGVRVMSCESVAELRVGFSSGVVDHDADCVSERWPSAVSVGVAVPFGVYPMVRESLGVTKRV